MTCDVGQSRCPAGIEAAFSWLRARDARWQATTVFGMSAFKRVWGDGTEDVVFALDDGHGYGVRHAPDLRLVVSLRGSLHGVADLVTGLDPPGSPCALQPRASAPHRGPSEPGLLT
jgi:hypothetical protein